MIRDFPAPAGLAEQLRSARAAGPEAARGSGGAPVRDAATVMLVRDGAAGIEVFLFRRVASMVFAAGMHVFPGGRTDEADADPQMPWEGPGPEVFAAAFGATPQTARALVVAAVRETFEECGVLLAAPPGGGPVTGLPPGTDRAAALRAVLGQEVTLAALLRDAGLVLRADALLPWARWVTPPGERRRYDARFFVAAMPPEQEALDLGGEAERAEWVAASVALERWHAGEASMLPPTVVCLEDLASAGDVATLRATPRVIGPVMPWAVETPDGGATVRFLVDGRGGGSLGEPVTDPSEATGGAGSRP